LKQYKHGDILASLINNRAGFADAFQALVLFPGYSGDKEKCRRN
jgi:hypothetical protein